jgi:hypothetical protein
MGILDVISGKVYKQNILVSDHVAKILQSCNKLDLDPFIKEWIKLSAVHIGAFLDEVLFSDFPENVENTYKKNLSKINQTNSFNLFKLLVSHYVVAFLSNKESSLYLQGLNITHGYFKNIVFSIYKLTKTERKEYSDKEDYYHKDTAMYFSKMEKRFWIVGYKIKNYGNVIQLMIFSQYLTNSYISFIDTLRKKI